MQERDSGALPRTGGKPSAGKNRKREGRRLGVLPLSVLLECGWGGNSRLSQRGLCLCPVQSVAVKDIAQHVFRAPLQLGQSQAALLIAFQGGGVRAALLIDAAGHQHVHLGADAVGAVPDVLKVRVGALAHPPVGHHAALIAPLAPQNSRKLWNSFVPVSAFQPENKDRRYPTVVVLHGGFNPISIIDGWGWVQEAARREWIVIVPSLELDDIVEEILEKAKALYPIDESRIYACGFSYGGFMSNLLGNKRPDIFAAVAPCGAPISNGYCDNAVGPEPQTPFDGKPRAIERNTYMPVMNIYGNLDGFRFPFYKIQVRDDVPASIAVTPKTVVDGINSWARVNHAKEISLEDVMALEDNPNATEEERNIGMPLEPGCGETIRRDGLTHYIGSLKSEDGVVRVRVMCSMNIPHWPTPEMSRQAFEFFSHFSRDPETKESVYQE